MKPSSFKVIITDADFPTIESELKILDPIGARIERYQYFDEPKLTEVCHDADAVLTQYAQISKSVILKMERARIIVAYGVGVDHIDVKTATERGIFVANVYYDTTDVADHAVALMLSFARRIVQADGQVRDGAWNPYAWPEIRRLKGATAGIIGFGRIGREVAKRVKGFGLQIMAYDPFIDKGIFEENGVQQSDLDSLLTESDFVFIHAMLTEENHHLLNEEKLRKVKRGSILINVARGPLVDEWALCKALDNKWLAGAALDVFEQEPLNPASPLRQYDNVILTPHMAYFSRNTLEEVQTKAAEQVRYALKGEVPTSLVNPEVKSKK